MLFIAPSYKMNIYNWLTQPSHWNTIIGDIVIHTMTRPF